MMFLAAGCASSPPARPASSVVPTITPAPSRPAVATPVATVAPPAASGHLIHVNLDVPMVASAPIGSTCAAAALDATGPVAATIPGSALQLLDFDRWDVPPPDPGETRRPLTVVGEQAVPAAGTVVQPISDDPGFPVACRFTFDVPTIADVKTAYAVSLGEVYFPMPLIRRDDLETTGWVVNIGVNPQ